MQVKNYELTIGYHNSWKFITDNKNKPHYHKINLMFQMGSTLTLTTPKPLELTYYKVEGGQLICILGVNVEY